MRVAADTNAGRCKNWASLSRLDEVDNNNDDNNGVGGGGHGYDDDNNNGHN
jgi:hypothetical protein